MTKLKRIPEPELMEDAEQARAYARGDFSEPNGLFCELLGRHLPPLPPVLRAIDLGCGPGDIPCELAARHARWKIVGVDGSAAMLAHARANVDRRGLGARVALVHGRIPEQDLGTEFDLVLSNSLLHHLPDPDILWRTVRHVAAPGAAVAIMDLARPRSRDEAASIVRTYADTEPAVLQHDFFHSLLAAFTVAEVKDQLTRARLGQLRVEMVSDRHLFAFGVLDTSA